MYAVIKTGGHQYNVKEGDQIEVDLIQGNEGDKIKFDQVLALGGKSLKLGAPLVAGAAVEGVIKKQIRQDKILVFKFRRRKNSKRLRGHKQPVTVVEISKINA